MVKYINKLVLLLSIFLLIGSINVAAAVEPTLEEILDTEYGPGNWVEIGDEVFNDGTSYVVVKIRDENSDYLNPVGWYSVSSGSEHLLFWIDTPILDTRVIDPDEDFGLFTYTDGFGPFFSHDTWYTETSKNSDGMKHARVFEIVGGFPMFVIGFEDTSGGDNDFNDVVVQLCGKDLTSIPEFPTVALPIAAILGLAFIFQRRKDE